MDRYISRRNLLKGTFAASTPWTACCLTAAARCCSGRKTMERHGRRGNLFRPRDRRTLICRLQRRSRTPENPTPSLSAGPDAVKLRP